MMRHRDAWAEHSRAPSKAAWQQEQQAAESESPQQAPVARRIVTATTPADAPEAQEGDALVVVSKLKKYIRDRAGMNTADNVQLALSNHLRKRCDQAIRAAGRAGRRIVMDRDFEFKD